MLIPCVRSLRWHGQHKHLTYPICKRQQSSSAIEMIFCNTNANGGITIFYRLCKNVWYSPSQNSVGTSIKLLDILAMILA